MSASIRESARINHSIAIVNINVVTLAKQEGTMFIGDPISAARTRICALDEHYDRTILLLPHDVTSSSKYFYLDVVERSA